MAKRDISPERKKAYAIGVKLMALGGILFLSGFVAVAFNLGSHSIGKATIFLPIIGMICLISGGVVAGIAYAGVAGSGLKLSPREAREDLEPWSRMMGGRISDALDEANIDLSGKSVMPFDEQLRRLSTLKSEGLLSEEDYETAKQRILDNLGN